MHTRKKGNCTVSGFGADNAYFIRYESGVVYMRKECPIDSEITSLKWYISPTGHVFRDEAKIPDQVIIRLITQNPTMRRLGQ